MIEGFHCPNCGKAFRKDAHMRSHMRDAHNPNSRTLASERPINRGPIPCGHPGCTSSFSNERNRDQHRRDKHAFKG